MMRDGSKPGSTLFEPNQVVQAQSTTYGNDHGQGDLPDHQHVAWISATDRQINVAGRLLQRGNDVPPDQLQRGSQTERDSRSQRDRQGKE